MRNITIDLIWTKIQGAVTALGGIIGYFVGGMDGLLTALVILMALDYITGVMCAIVAAAGGAMLKCRGRKKRN